MKKSKIYIYVIMILSLSLMASAAITQGTFAGLTPHSWAYPSLANDNAGNTYLLVRESSTNYELWIYDGTNWSYTSEITATSVNADADFSLVSGFTDYLDVTTDNNGNFHAVIRYYKSNSNRGVMHAEFDGTNWDFDIVVEGTTETYDTPKIVIDDNNFAHVVYDYRGTSGANTVYAIVHTHNKTGSWSAPESVATWSGSTNTGVNEMNVGNIYVNSNNIYLYYEYEEGVNTTHNVYTNIYTNATSSWGANSLLYEGVTNGNYYLVLGRYIEGANAYFAVTDYSYGNTYFKINSDPQTLISPAAGRSDYPYDMETDGNGNYYMLIWSEPDTDPTATYMYMRGYDGNSWTNCSRITQLDLYPSKSGTTYTVRPDGKVIVIYTDYVTSSPWGDAGWTVGEIADFMPSNCFTPQGAALPPTMGTTVAVSNITASTATSGGNITNDNGDAVTVSGVCWNTATAPTTANSKSTDGDNAGAFTSNLTGLSSNTLYYVRSYATNAGGTSYGTEVTFRTLAIVPNAPTVNNASATTLDVTLAVDGNNAATTFAIQETSTGDYVQAGGALGAAPVWQTNANWGTVTVTGLTRYTEYTFQVKARNSDNVETAFGTSQARTTLQTIPTLAATTAESNLTSNSASSGGEITDDGGAAVTVRGVCWNTTGTPDINDSKTTDGTGSGTFTSDITGLTPNTLYYVRSYATNSVGTAYGAQIQFTTLNISVAITNAIKNTDTEYQLTAEITNPAADPILAKGYVWSTSQNPTTTLNSGSTSNGTGDASYTDNATITIGPGYYVRAYITTAGGTTYSEAVHFGVIPTLPEWGLIFLAAGFVLGGGWFAFRRIL